METLNEKYIRSKITRRSRDAHKGDFGKVLIYAGSVGMAGAAVLCGQAALKSGAGLVRFLLPELGGPLYQILQCCVPEATCVKYTESIDFSEYRSIAAGPGLGQDDGASYILKDIISRYNGILVLDADALNIISSSEEMTACVQQSTARIIMTPHPGEARRLLGTSEGDQMTMDLYEALGRLGTLKSLSEKYYSIIVLKGAGTLVGTDEDAFINPTGNPGMATGGSGDVLAGLIASLAAQGLPAMDAAAAGVYIHGYAGDLAAEKLGEMGMTSSDIADMLPEALKKYYPSV